jgi:hypothetical protein
VVAAAGGTRSLPRWAEELARRRCRVPGWSPAWVTTRYGKARTRRSAWARTEAAAGETAGALAREAVAVRRGTVSRPLISGEPRARANRALVLFERVLAERLSGRRAAGEAALRCRLVRRTARRRAVPRPGLRAAGPAHGQAAVRSPVAGAGETRCAVRSARRAATRSTGERRARWREGHAREAGARPAAVARAAVLPRAAAVLRPGSGIGFRLPAPPP